MEVVAKQHINFIKFSELYNWSVSHILGQDFGYNQKFSLVKIGKFLIKNSNVIHVDNGTVYKRVTVGTNNGGVRLRNTEIGKNIGTKRQFVINQGQFIISKIDARNGAMGLIPKELTGAIVTNDFPTYDIDTNAILPQFLLLITTTKKFIEFAQSCSSGTTNRQRINLKKFLEVQIPLPPLEKQKALVKDYQENLNRAEKLKTEVINLEKESEEILLKELGLELRFDKLIEKGKINLIEFKELERWDVWNTVGNIISNKYALQKFKDVITGKPLYGANVRGIKRKSETRYIRITDINEDGSLNDEFVSPEKVEEKYLLKENDFLIARSGNTVGKTFLYKEKYGRCVYAGYLVKYNLGRKILPEFLLHYTKGKAFKHWISQNQRVSGQPNINGQEYLKFPIPVPSIEKQKEIVDSLSINQQIIMQKKKEFDNLKEQAVLNFENAIFKTESE